ncbi:FAD-binding oxidoreductase [uncultured Zhongshania sp.]|uniref:FAD-binding oxidoreductase n=1 Tax=uncultured Zhongshania sp. TaxID=1642288 RepID=UPI0025F4885F|nr:FAD-binding oxidoreductase [uncultured Zhongshania sp.]
MTDIKQPENLLSQLELLLGKECVLTGDALRERASSYWDSSPMQGIALLKPHSTEQLSAAMKLCHQFGQTVVTHGGLTGCVEGATVDNQDVIISLEKMNSIEEIDAVGSTVIVQAGVTLQYLQEAVSEQGLYFPLDLGARGSCTIGGNVATNAGGINVIRYGMMRDQVLGLEVVLADGTIMSSMNRMLKNNAGYDLKQLFIGTEGTLGIVTRVSLKLQQQTRSRNTCLVAVDDFASVTKLLSRLQGDLGAALNAYEVMWGDYFHAVTEPGWHRAPMGRDYAFYVLLEAAGADAEGDGPRFIAAMESAMEAGLVVDAIIPKSESERRALWDIREDFDAIVKPQPTFLYDVSLPIKFMEDYVAAVKQGLDKLWPQSKCYIMGHMGDGNLHLFITPNSAGDDLHGQSDEQVYKPLEKYAGSISAEHGIGTEKKSWLLKNRSIEELDLMKVLKRALDPLNILNRGKIFDV